MLKKTNIIKFLIVFIFFGGFLNIQPLLAAGLKDGFSATGTGELSTFAQASGYSTPQTPEYYVGLVLNTIFALLGIIAVSLFFYSGFTWMTARGNEEKVTKAKENFINAIIGLIIIIASYAITTFILKIFV